MAEQPTPASWHLARLVLQGVSETPSEEKLARWGIIRALCRNVE